ncbi:hypothetical protein SAMN05421509_105274 [Chromohalobacter canadensis]|uniref:Uncharacterized protein n=1 Tax=Chromohalobacter canadensis TaxID=141389 RepID=A0A285VNQ6_9GAMM|nr:hypothetical protein [Chromohalobacter canadensis]SOC55700.1 hypothetical protein SAMN05421509_105274 [Chromohalobacter canadensis]
MDKTKIRIDLVQGIIEAEGDSAFVKSVYDDFKDRLNTQSPKAAQDVKKEAQEKPASAPTKKAAPVRKKKASGGSASGKMVNDLDLSGGGGAERLKDFFSQYKISSNYERNLIFVYYLQHRLNIQGITIDHVFTCYRDVGVKVPSALQQSLWDTSRHKGWLDTNNGENITTTVPGMNHLEHDLKKQEDE